jgi:hypothetical protein
VDLDSGVGTPLPFMLAWLWPSCGMSGVLELGSALSSMFVRSVLAGLLLGCCVVGVVSVLLCRWGEWEGVSLQLVSVGLVGWRYWLWLLSLSGYRSMEHLGWPLVNEGGATETLSLQRPPVVASRLSLPRIKPWESCTVTAVAVQGASVTGINHSACKSKFFV